MCIISAGAAAAMGTSAFAANATLASVALTAVSTVATMQAQQQQGDYAAQEAAYAASLSGRDAQAAEMRAQDAEFRGRLEKQDRALQVEQLKAAGQTNYAAGNVQLGSGSPLDWEVDVSERQAADDRMTEYNAEVEAWGEKVKAGDSRSQAQLQRMAGTNKRSAAGQASVGTMLSGASKIGQMAYSFSK